MSDFPQMVDGLVYASLSDMEEAARDFARSAEVSRSTAAEWSNAATVADRRAANIRQRIADLSPLSNLARTALSGAAGHGVLAEAMKGVR